MSLILPLDIIIILTLFPSSLCVLTEMKISIAVSGGRKGTKVPLGAQVSDKKSTVDWKWTYLKVPE